MNADQIAAEVVEQIARLETRYPALFKIEALAHIKSAIEKAWREGYVDGSNYQIGISRAAHETSAVADASEQGAEKLAQELRNIVNCDLAGMRKDFGEYADSQFRQWAQNRAKAALSEYESQRPIKDSPGRTPATASEIKASGVEGGDYPFQIKISSKPPATASTPPKCPHCGKVARTDSEGPTIMWLCCGKSERKPDSASTGKARVPHFSEQAKSWTPAATPSGGGEQPCPTCGHIDHWPRYNQP